MFTDGSTFLSFKDMIKIQILESKLEIEIEVVKENTNGSNNTIRVKSSWQQVINILQTQEKEGYGTEFREIPIFHNYQNSFCFTWSLFALLSSSKEFWEVIDSKPEPFKSSSWEGHILTAIQSLCFQNNFVPIEKMSPFKKPTTSNKVIEHEHVLTTINHGF